MSEGRYRVVGCRSCDGLWVIDARASAEETSCPRCEARWERRMLRSKASADELDVARELRGRLLADRAGHLDVILDEDDYGVLEDRIRTQLEAERELYGERVDLRPLGSDEYAEEAAEVLDRRDELLADEAEAYLQQRDQLYAEAAEAHLARRSPVVGDTEPEPDSDESDAVDDPDDEPASELASSDARDPSIRAVTAGDQPDLARLPVRGVGPQLTNWIPDLLEDLLPTMTQAVRSFALDAGHAPIEGDRASTRHRAVGRELLDELAPDAIEGTDSPEIDVSTVEYLYAAAEWALEYADVGDVEQLPQREQARREELRHTLTTIGTGRGSMNAGHEALDVVAALLAEAPERPILRVYLDAKAWGELDDRATGERALDALTTLATGLDVEVVLSSPGLVRSLSRRYEDWLQEHLGFTASAEWWGEAGEDATTDQEARATAQAALAEITQEGQIRVLAHMPEDGSPHQQRSLVDDPEVALSVSGVSRAVSALVEAGLLEKDTEPRHNVLRLSEAGQIAQEYVADDYTVCDPRQTTLGTGLAVPPVDGGRFTETLQSKTGTVYSANEHGDPPQEGDAEGREPSPEDVICATGEAHEDGFVQWLDGTPTFNKWAMQQRITDALRGDGVTLVDDRIGKLEDGRVAQISCFEDEFLGIVEWGDVLPTLGRITSALLDGRALGKVLTSERTGEEFENLHGGRIEDLSPRADDVVRWGHQVGWFSEDQQTWTDWKKRYGSVKSMLLKELPEAHASDDQELRGQLIRDFLGIITSATHLYYAAGIDVVINLRIPDVRQLLDEQRLGNFLGFVEHVIPKQTTYQHHSGYRMLLEDRPEKLKARLSYEIDPEAPGMDMTASWLISGPTITELQDEIEDAIQGNQADLREQIAEGNEQAAVMEIPVFNANTYTSIRQIISDRAVKKGFIRPEAASRDAQSREAIERLTRLFISSLNTPETPHRANPHDVAEALLRISQSDRGSELTVDDVAFGLSQLPPDRLLSELTPSTTKCLQELLVADEPLGRSAIVERADVSGQTWDRNYELLAALDLVEPVEVDGYRRWTATLEPWWSPGRQAEINSDDEVPEQFWDDHDFHHVVGRSGSTSRESVLSTIALRIGKLLGDDGLIDSWMNDEDWPAIDPLTSYASPSALDDWRGFLWAATTPIEDLEAGPPGRRDRDSGLALIGRLPPGAEPEQLQLEASATPDDALATVSPGLAADGGKPAADGDVGHQ